MKTTVCTIGLHIISGKPFVYVMRVNSKGDVRRGRGYHPSYHTVRLLAKAVQRAAEWPYTRLILDIDGWVYVSW